MLSAPYRLPETFKPLCDVQLVVVRGSDRCFEWRHMETRVDWVGQGELVFELVQRCHRGRCEIRRTLYCADDGTLVEDLFFKPLVGRLEDYRLFLARSDVLDPLELDASGQIRITCLPGATPCGAPLELAPKRMANIGSRPPLERLLMASVALLQLEGKDAEAGRALLAAGDIPGARRCLTTQAFEEQSALALILLEELQDVDERVEAAAQSLVSQGTGSPAEIRALNFAARTLGSDALARQAAEWDQRLELASTPDLLLAILHGVRDPRDPVVRQLLDAFDKELRVETRRGTSWRPKKDLTYGTALLTIQRAHVEALFGRRKEARRLLHLVASQAGGALLIPERIDASQHSRPLLHGADLGKRPDLQAHAHAVQALKSL